VRSFSTDYDTFDVTQQGRFQNLSVMQKFIQETHGRRASVSKSQGTSRRSSVVASRKSSLLTGSGGFTRSRSVVDSTASHHPSHLKAFNPPPLLSLDGVQERCGIKPPGQVGGRGGGENSNTHCNAHEGPLAQLGELIGVIRSLCGKVDAQADRIDSLERQLQGNRCQVGSGCDNAVGDHYDGRNDASRHSPPSRYLYPHDMPSTLSAGNLRNIRVRNAKGGAFTVAREEKKRDVVNTEKVAMDLDDEDYTMTDYDVA